MEAFRPRLKEAGLTQDSALEVSFLFYHEVWKSEAKLFCKIQTAL